MDRHAHYVRRNGLALEILRAIDGFSKLAPELTEGEIQVTLLELMFQRAERRSLIESARETVLTTAIALSRAENLEDATDASMELDDAVDEYLGRKGSW